MSFAPGTRIGAFEITGTLGAGGMSASDHAEPRLSRLKRGISVRPCR